MEDQIIVALYWSRDQRALGESQKKYGSLCFRLSENILASREDAEECVSDALYAAWRQIPPLIPRSLRTFLGRVTRNLSVSRYRADRAGKRSCGMDELLSELSDCLPDGCSVEEEADSRALSVTISGWLDTLSPGDRELFVRRYWFCDSLTDIAAQMEETPQQLAQRTYRLRKLLKQCLEKEGYTI